MKRLLVVLVFFCFVASAHAAQELHEYWQVTPTNAQKIINGTLVIKNLGSSIPGATISPDGVITCTLLNATTIQGTVVYTSTSIAISAENVGDGTLGTGVIAQTIANGAISYNQLGSGVMKVYDYAVEFSTPGAMGTGPWLISPYRSYSVSIATISAHVVGDPGSTVTFSLRIRDAGLSDASSGTSILSANVTAGVSGFTGGTPSNFYVPANSCMAVHVVSTAGTPSALVIKYRLTVN
jgi:hypothetical protein